MDSTGNGVWLTEKWEASRILGGAKRFEATNQMMQETDLRVAAATEALLTSHAHSKHSYHFKMFPTSSARVKKTRTIQIVSKNSWQRSLTHVLVLLYNNANAREA